MMHLSIVTTLYRSVPYIYEFYQRMSNAASKVTKDYEIVFINDGSDDESLEKAVEIHRNDHKVKVVDLSRNFGHHKAIMAGLSQAKGENIFLIDCDLEEDPELLEVLHAKLNEAEDADVVYGIQRSRKGGFVEKKGGELFYKLFNRLSGLSLQQNPLTIRIMTRRYVNALLVHEEEELFLAGLFEITGFKQIPLEVNKKSRQGSTYTFKNRLRMLTRGITSFSSFPLLVSFYIGGAISITSFLFMVYLLIIRLIYNEGIIVGWTSVMISIWFLGGVILLSCGMIGIYLSRVYYEVKRRPNYIIRKVYEDV
jgi:putative glycosyltransferase